MLAFLVFIILLPVVMMLVGVVQLLTGDAAKKRTGRNLLLGGILILGVELLIGYSVCSGMH